MANISKNQHVSSDIGFQKIYHFEFFGHFDFLRQKKLKKDVK
jgi:hypothetical protein